MRPDSFFKGIITKLFPMLWESETSKVQFVKRVGEYVKDNPVLEHFFKDKPDYIKEVAQKAADLENDPSTSLGSKDLLHRTIKVSLYQQVLYCGKCLEIGKSNALTTPLFVQL
jgi:hypothetical protein